MTVNLHGISRESFDMIVEEEVSGKPTYEKKYVHPEKPGGQSGVTVGIGYDAGYSSAATIRKDWEGKIPHPMVEALASCAGIKGNDAFAACNRVRGVVSVPWEAAIDVFSNVSIPKYMAATRKGLPGYDNLAPDCKGVLLSLVYNRGASFTTAGDRYTEMRAIRAAMISGNLAAIPGELRKMKRLWTNKSTRGVATRREHEARLFERGLATQRAAVLTEPAPGPEEHGEDGTAPFPTARANADAATVATIAPEVVPVQQNRTLTIWAAVCTFFTGVYKTFSDSISSAWDFVFDHKDDIPTDPGVLQTVWGWVTSLPAAVWIFAGTIGFVLIAIRLHGAVKKITEDVKTGARQ